MSTKSTDDSVHSPPPVAQSEEPYSVFTQREKWFIVSLIAFGGLFSPLSANIYFPAIPAIAEAFRKSVELINLTVTLNMVFQGISPMFWGTISDTYGRRLPFILCLLLLCLSCVGLALTPTNAYWLLMLLRCFQAAGSASTVAITVGVISDICTRAERGGFLGLATIGPMIGPAIGPVLGGVLADKLGWRAIFWFLCIASGVCMIVMVLFLPETLRAIAGNGSISLPPIYHAVVPVIGRSAKQYPPATATTAPRRKFQNPLLLFLHVDIAALLLINAILNSVLYGITASISSVFHDAYPQLNETELGLCFLTLGGGLAVGSIGCGKLLDRDYQRLRRRLIAQASKAGKQADEKTGTVDDEAFPIERARLRLLPAFVGLFVASCIGYGWCIEERTSMAGPLIFLFFVGVVVITVMNSTQTLMVDLIPTQGSAITACNNLVRCSLGAGLVSAMQPLLDALGAGYAYLLLGGISALMAPLMYFVIYIGPRCRARRIRMADARQEHARAKEEEARRSISV